MDKKREVVMAMAYDPFDNDNDSDDWPDRTNDSTLSFDVDRVVAETKDAWLLEVGEAEPVWFPKSICQLIIPSVAKVALLATHAKPGKVIVPEWLAISKGLV